MSVRKVWIVWFAAASLALMILGSACGPGKEGARCQSSQDCETSLRCVDFVCKTAIKPAEKVLEENIFEPTPELNSEEVVSDGGGPEEATSTPEEATSTPEEATSTPEEATSTPEESTSTPEEATNPEPQPESSTGLTLYDLLDPSSTRAPQEGAEVELPLVVMMSPVSRLTATLDLFFVQEPNARQGTFRYGGLAVLFERASIQLGTLSVGTRVSLKGRFTRYRTVDWNSTCATDLECPDAVRKQCADVYDKQTSTIVKRCASSPGVPQLELSQTPAVVGAGPVPSPEEVQPADINKDGVTAQAYLGVYVELKQVQVTSRNPDDPSDFGEFVVAQSANPSEGVRIDDQINTISYSGAKYCSCGSGGSAPDNSYCLPGDTCQCAGAQVCGGTKTGCCFAQGTQPTQDTRTQGDTFTSIRGVLYFSFGNYKVLPRTPTDMQK